MGLCGVCGREMLAANGCGVPIVTINGKKFNRIKVGASGDFFEGAEKGTRCGDCAAKVGFYHHWGCDCERCPFCGGQLIGCDCQFVFAGSSPRHGRRWFINQMKQERKGTRNNGR